MAAVLLKEVHKARVVLEVGWASCHGLSPREAADGFRLTGSRVQNRHDGVVGSLEEADSMEARGQYSQDDMEDVGVQRETS